MVGRIIQLDDGINTLTLAGDFLEENVRSSLQGHGFGRRNFSSGAFPRFEELLKQVLRSFAQGMRRRDHRRQLVARRINNEVRRIGVLIVL